MYTLSKGKGLKGERVTTVEEGGGLQLMKGERVTVEENALIHVYRFLTDIILNALVSSLLQAFDHPA